MKNNIVTILAIDDIQDNILVLKVLVSEAFPSADFYSANTGRKGIELCKLHKPDVVLLDIAMPEMDGYEVCKIIKSDEQLKHIPVVMVTSTTVTGRNRILAMDAGADAFLAKPVDESELTAQIRAMLRIKEAEDHKISEKERLEILVQERTMELEQELVDRRKAEDALHQSLLKLEKSRNSELKLLADLRSEVTERKRAEEQVLNHLHDQQIISEVARAMVSIKTKDDVYEYIGARIHEVTDNAYVLVVKANNDNQSISISHTFGLQKLIGKIKRTIGFDVLSLKVSLNNLTHEQNLLYQARELTHITQNPLYTISAHTVDKMICKSIEKLIGITSVYSIGFLWEEQLFGGIAIICKNNSIINQHKLVETIANLGSIALQRLNAEEDLQKEHKNLNAILSSSPVSMLVIDENAQIIKANPAASRLFNTNIHNIEKRLCGEFLGCVNRLENEKGCGHSSHCAACNIMNSINKALQHQVKSIDQESEIMRETERGISRLWIQFSIEPLLLNGKKHLILALHDNTQRKKAEEEKLKTEKRYRSLIEYAPDGIVLIDSIGEMKFASNSAIRMFGYDANEMSKLIPNELTHPDDLKLVLAAMSDLIADPSKVHTLEYRFKHADGSWHWIQSTFSNLMSDKSVEAIVINFRDINESVKAAEELKQSEQMYRLLADNVSDVIWTMDNNFKYTFISPSIYQLRGLTQAEAMVENYEQSMNPASLQIIKKNLEEGMRNEASGIKVGPGYVELQQYHKDGSLIWVEIAIHIIYNHKGIRTGIIGVSRDASNRKQAEAELNESRQQLMDIIDFLPDATFVIDNDKKVIAWNKAIEEMTGVSKTDMIGKGNHAYSIPFYGRRQRLLLDLIDNKDNDLKARYSNFYRKGNSISAEIFAPELFEGKGAFISTISAPLFNSNGDRLGYIESIRDITESRKATQALKESEEKYRSMVDLLPDAVIIHSENKILFANSAARKMVGIKSLKQLTAKTFLDFVHPDTVNFARKRINQILLTGKPSNFAEEKIITINNETIEVEVIGIPVTYNGKPAIQTIARDITLRKKAEQEIKLRDELLHLTGDMAKVGGWEFDTATKQGTWTDEVARIHDLDADALTNVEIGISFYKDDSWLKITNAIQAAVDHGTPYDLELEMTSAKGIKKWVRTMGVPVMDGHKIIKIRGIYQDITSRKEAELVLENERLRLRTLIKTIPDLIWLKDPDGKFLLCNPIFESFIGIPETDLLGKTDFDFESPELAEISKQRDIKLMLLNNPVIYEEWGTRKSDGQKRLIETIKTPMFDTEGKLIGILGVGRDITQYYESQESLREREEIYSTIVNQAYDAIVLVDIETGNFLEFNEAACSRLGYTREEFEKLTLKDIELSIKPENLSQTLQDLRLGISSVFETKHRTKSGETRDMRISSRVITISGVDYLSTIWTDITEKNKSEALLREKDLIFQSLLEYSPVHLFFKDHDSKAMHLSRNYELLLGKPLSEIIGKDAHELFPTDYADELIAREKQMFSDGKLVEFNETLNGRFYTTIKFPIFRDDALPMLAGFTIDITDRKIAEEALKENEEKLLTLINSSPDIICFKDAENKWIQANDSILELYQLKNVDYYNKTESELAAFTSGIFKEAFDNSIITDEIAWTNETGTRTEEIIPDINGSLHVYDIIKRPLYHADKKRKGLVVFGRDITERKKAEEALRKSEANIRSLIENADSSIWSIDKQFNLIDANAHFYQNMLSGTGHNVSIGDNVLEILPENIRTDWFQFYQRALSGESFSIQTSTLPPLEIQMMSYSFNPIVTSDNTLIGITIFGHNITALNKAQEEISLLNTELEQRVQQRTRQLEQANKELEAFSYSVSHDLRAPLRGIDGWSLALLEDYYDQLDEPGRVFLDRVRSEAQRMGHLIDDLLKLSRVSRFEMKQVDVNLSELAHTITNRLVETHANRKFDIRIEQDLIAICDPAMLEIVLTNLFDNACKFSGLEPESSIEFGKLEADEMTIFYIRDNGVGFDMENARNLFGAFQRMHKQSEFQGSGIGLATVQRIIHRHGGRIWAESRAGEGAVFYFTLLL
jgi:PAS domain S-box-containing protein